MQRAERNALGLALGITVAIVIALTFGAQRLSYARDYTEPVPAPPLSHQQPEAWINSSPLTWEVLRGKVVLVDFWTFGCWNCFRSFPWLNSLEQRFGDQGFVVIGVHTPEFEHEKDRAKVIEKVREFELTHPVMMDNDYAYWKAIGNRYWPTFYLIDAQGRLRAYYIGETHSGDPQAREIEKQIMRLMAERR